MLWLTGETAIDVRFAEFTVKLVVPVLLPSAAVIVAEPDATDVAKPAELIVATDVDEELHVTDAVIFCCEPSE
jgi:hypothetical protein